jgi:hypothetical protein
MLGRSQPGPNQIESGSPSPDLLRPDRGQPNDHCAKNSNYKRVRSPEAWAAAESPTDSPSLPLPLAPPPELPVTAGSGVMASSSISSKTEGMC